MSDPAGTRSTFAVVGCGKVGTALAVYLSRAGYPAAAAVSRSAASAKKTAALCGAPSFGTQAWSSVQEADIVLITTPDGEIEPTCRRIVEHRGIGPESVVLHCSGALPSTILASARSCGAAIGSLHPLQSFAAAQPETDPFSGIVFAVEGDESARQTGKRIAADLGGKALLLRTEGKALYHASAVAASNYLVSLFHLAAELLAASGISEDRAFDVLGPLIHGTLGNIEQLGATAALTGPIARGDRETVSRHMDDIRRHAPLLLPLYSALGRHTVTIALRGGRLSGEAAQGLLRLFDRGF